MSIQASPERNLPVAILPPSWGELALANHQATVVRFVLVGRIITFPISELRRWEHIAGASETLVITFGGELVVVEGRDLGAIRIALELGRLEELRVNYPAKTIARPGPQVRRITVKAE